MIHKKEESRVYCATGNGGGVKPDCSPEGSVDKSWEQSGNRDSVSWDAEAIQKKSPIKDRKNVESILISNAGEVRDAMKGFGITLDDAVNLGGGAIRGSHITVDGFYGDIEVTTIFPINPDDESEGYVASSVTIVRDNETENIHYAGTGEPSIHYGTMFPYKEIRPDRDGRILPVGDLKPDKLSKSQKARISSILLERFVESVSVAEGKGFSYAEMLAVGDSAPGSDKGYRLWPQFGFDATVPQRFMRIMPDDIAVKSAGISVPPEGSVRAPRDTIIKGLRARVKDLTIQQLISTPEGKRWWEEKGGSVDLRLDLNDKASPGYQRFLEKKAQVERLKKRNETRSLAELYDEIVSQRAFCPNGEGGGVSNDCSSEEGGGTATAPPASDTIRSGSTVPITSGKQWKKADDIVSYSGKDIPAKPLKNAESVAIVHGKLLDSALKDIGVTLDQAAEICAATVPGAVVVAMHGTLKETESYFDDPENADNSSPAATFFSKVDIDGIDNAVAIGTTIVKDEDGRIVLSYGMLDVVDEAKESSPIAVARAMYRGVAESINAAEKAGVEEIVMFAAGGKGDTDRFSGYRIWPRLGFDAVIPRSRITPIWSPLTGFFNSYGSSIPDRILSPRALSEKKEGLLTIQALYETKEGQQWWEANGGPMVMTMQVGDKSEPGWQRFLAMRDKATRRSLSNDEFFEWLDFEWRHIVEQRAFCPTGEDGGVLNTCSSEGGTGDGSIAKVAKAAKEKNVDVMIGDGKRVAVMDKEARDRAIADLKSNPKPEGSSAGSTTDVWDRTFVTRPAGSNKISESDPVFPSESLRQNGQYVAHEAVGQYLSMRHEEERAAAGGGGPGSIIDLNDSSVDDRQVDYVADALTEDAVHAYEVLGVDPGFYSTDLEKTMSAMSRRHPELESDENSKFIFTALLAITSSGQGPDSNLADADGLYRMWKEHGTVVPSSYGGGARDVTTSLRNLQSLIDSVGIDRTRNILSGYAPASRVAKTFRTLAEKSGDPNWRERTGSSELNLPKPLQVTGELKDEVVPLFSVFGPKIGSFYANLTGRHDFLTMDRWLMRSVGRVTGDLITRSTPEQAKTRARAILDAIESGKWKKAYLFGTDATLGLTKEALVRSLKIQEKTGVIEESGPAFAWATAAERSHQKTKSKTGGSYGKHEDDTIDAMHRAGNSLFKSLIHEQQDPRTGTARSNIRDVFRRIQDKFEQETGRRPDVDEIQAALWQYEKRLWKHLGAKTNIEDNSLFSSAADGVISGKIAPRKYSPADKRSQPREDDPDVEFDTHHFDAEQSIWMSDLIESGVDIVSLLSELEGDVNEKRNFAALDFGIAAATAFVGRVAESFGVRAFCPSGEGNGIDNSCASTGSKVVIAKSAKESTYDNPKSHFSWMSPSGKFFPIPSLTGSHHDWAQANVKIGGKPASEESLKAAGWVRVTLDSKSQSVIVDSGGSRPLSGTQKSIIKDLAITGGYDGVIQDAGASKKTVSVWRRSVLEAARAFCPTGDGGGVDNSCSAESTSTPQLHSASVKLTAEDMMDMVQSGGSVGEDVDKAMSSLRTTKRFELVGAITQSMPLDSTDAGEFALRTVESAAAKGKPVPKQLSRQIADAVEGIYGSSIQYAKDNNIPRGEAINQAAMASACFISQVASGVKEFPEIVDAPVSIMRRHEVFDELVAQGTPPQVAANLAQSGAAFYAGKEDKIVINADNGVAYINSILSAAASDLNEDTGKWESATGGVPFYSTSQLGHSLVHEHGHMVHYRAIRDSLGIPQGKTLDDDEARLLEKALSEKGRVLLDHLRQNLETAKKLQNISGYAMTNPVETVAEYYTSLALGVAKRDSDIDEVMVIMGFPADRLPPGKKGAKKK